MIHERFGDSEQLGVRFPESEKANGKDRFVNGVLELTGLWIWPEVNLVN